MHCQSCHETSLNLVSRRHLDEPFYHDRVVAALERPVGEIAEIESFRSELWSGRFDDHRTDLAAEDKSRLHWPQRLGRRWSTGRLACQV